MMFEGKEKRLDLIQELRATEEWKASAENEEERNTAILKSEQSCVSLLFSFCQKKFPPR